jgi:hypothetical protein
METLRDRAQRASEQPHTAEPAETSDFIKVPWAKFVSIKPTSKGNDDGDSRMAGDDWPEVNGDLGKIREPGRLVLLASVFPCRLL